MVELEPTVYSVWEPLVVLAHNEVLKEGEIVTQVLVHWKDKSLEEATSEDVMAEQFPSLNLGDKVVSQRVDIDGDT
ncbi:hypothetical protein A2U01_0071435, partial [Trifolium medium]|nr:hypothetical protein [Trifolium medium]